MVPRFPAPISETVALPRSCLWSPTIRSKGILQVSSRLALAHVSSWEGTPRRWPRARATSPSKAELAPLVAEEEAQGEMTHCCWLRGEAPPRRNAGASRWEGSVVNGGNRVGLQFHNRRNSVVPTTWMSLEVAFPSEPPGKAAAWQPDISPVIRWANTPAGFTLAYHHCVLSVGMVLRHQVYANLLCTNRKMPRIIKRKSTDCKNVYDS